MSKPTIVPQKPKLKSKISSEKRDINKINSIDSIRGVQYMNRLIFIGIFLHVLFCVKTVLADVVFFFFLVAIRIIFEFRIYFFAGNGKNMLTLFL